MSYGSEICANCGGEVTVYIEGDGSAYGTCHNCGTILNFGPRRIPSRIPDEGAFYEVIVEECYKNDDGASAVGPRESIATYTNIKQALAKCKEVSRSRFDGPGDDIEPIYSYIKKWNHDRTEWEWVRPEHIKGVEA